MKGHSEPHSPGSESISSSLLDALKANEQEAWRRFVVLFGPLIYRWCRQCAIQPTDAADIGQAVLSATSRGIKRFRRDQPKDTFRGWLWTITRNKIRDFYRARRVEENAAGGTAMLKRLLNEPALSYEEMDTQAGLNSADGLRHRALELVKSEFEERTWEAFVRATLQQQKAREIASDLGMSEAAVYKAKSRVLARLRAEFDGLLE